MVDKFSNYGAMNVKYIYSADGVKQRKIVNELGTINRTDYSGGYIYRNGKLEFIRTAEGYAMPSGSGYRYVYEYKDHLGNIRLSYTDANGDGKVTKSEIIEENNYYPFGLKHKGYNTVLRSTGNDLAQKYKYNGKELNEELGLNWYDYGARNYQAELGRWFNVDPLAEKYFNVSSYNYCVNNPIVFVDPDGRDIVVTTNGGKQLFTLSDGNKSITKLTARQIYDRGIQWFESTADNYMPLISKAEGLSTFSELKHFSWNEVAEFAETDRSMLSYRSGGAGDWKADGKPGDGYLMVTVDGEPYWTDAVGQIPFAVDKFTDELESTGNASTARERTIEAGQTFGDGNIIGGESDNTNSYDNAMIKRAINWAEKRYKVVKGSGWFGDNYDLQKTNHSPSNLSKQSDEKQ